MRKLTLAAALAFPFVATSALAADPPVNGQPNLDVYPGTPAPSTGNIEGDDVGAGQGDQYDLNQDNMPSDVHTDPSIPPSDLGTGAAGDLPPMDRDDTMGGSPGDMAPIDEGMPPPSGTQGTGDTMGTGTGTGTGTGDTKGTAGDTKGGEKKGGGKDGGK